MSVTRAPLGIAVGGFLGHSGGSISGFMTIHRAARKFSSSAPANRRSVRNGDSWVYVLARASPVTVFHYAMEPAVAGEEVNRWSSSLWRDRGRAAGALVKAFNPQCGNIPSALAPETIWAVFLESVLHYKSQGDS